MEDSSKAGSWELPTYQQTHSLSYAQAKIEVNSLFLKIQLAEKGRWLSS